jgi:hypothetical protein
MAPEFLGAVIALVSALLAVLLVEFLSNRRINRRRIQDQIDRSRQEHQELMKPRYELASMLAGRVNQGNLEIIEGYHVAERARHEHPQTFEESISTLRGQLINKGALYDIDQMLSLVQTIGDDELIDAAGELNGVFNGLLGWIEKKFSSDQDEILFAMEDTQVIESARSGTLFYHGRIIKRLDGLQNGVWILDQDSIKK